MSELDRLAHAIQLFLSFQATPSPREAWLQANADCRDLLEPLLAELDDIELDNSKEDVHQAQVDRAVDTPVRVKRSAETGAVESLGPYRVVRTLGEGGMGTVYLAQQSEPIQRRVALKVIRRGMETRNAIARFATERQALARMDHPNIAKVFDAGATSDRCPYFVMEYVSGDRMTRYCDENNLSIRERVSLFTRVCDGVHHAHQNGIIHRDLKPSNILISKVDGKGTPKIIDFGIAKLTSRDLEGHRGLETQTGGILGTPLFMSPEQLESSGDPIDTRTDIYSLGVLLYELLVGRLPFDLETETPDGLAELCRVVRHVDPPRPSTRIGRHADTEGELAARRSATLRNWQRGLKGELDSIVLRCLEKERNRRYDSASALAHDLRRYLADEPVLASPPSNLYRARKLVRRNRGLVTAAAMVLLSLVAGLGWALLEKSRADDKATELSKQVYRANLALAAHDIDEGRLASAHRFLDATADELRGWEWRHLEAKLEPSLRRFDSPPGNRCSLAVGADGETLVTAMADGTIRLRNLRTGDLVRTITSEGIATHCSVDRACQRLVALGVADKSKGARLWVGTWDLPSCEPIDFFWLDPTITMATRRHFSFDPEFAYPLGDIDAESRKVVLSTPTGIKICDIERRSIVAERSLEGRTPRVHFSPRGRYVVVTEKFVPTELVDAVTLETAARLGALDIWSFAMSPDETQIVASGSNGFLAIFDVARALRSGELEKPFLLDAKQGAVRRLVYSDDGSTLVTVGDGWSPKTWNTHTWEPLDRYPALVHGIDWLCAMTTSRSFMTVEPNGVFRFWSNDVDDPTVLRGHESFAYYVDVDTERGLILTGGWDGYVYKTGSFRLWDLESGDPVAAWGESFTWSEGVLFAPEAGSLLTLAMVHPRGRTTEKERQLFARIDLESGSESVVVRAIQGVASWCKRRGRDGIWGITSVGDLLQIDADTGGSTLLQTPWKKVWGSYKIAVSADGKKIAIANARHVTLRQFGSDWSIIHDLGAHQKVVTDLDFDPLGRQLLSASEDGTVIVWDVHSGEATSTIDHDVGVLTARFDPRGTRIATGGRDGTIRIWGGSSHEQLATLLGHQKYVSQVKWQDDGERLYSTSGDATVRIWETNPIRNRHQARRDRKVIVETLTPAIDAWLSRNGASAKLSGFVKEANLNLREEQVARQILLGRRLGQHSD